MLTKKQKQTIYKAYETLKFNDATNPADIKTILQVYTELKKKISDAKNIILEFIETN